LNHNTEFKKFQDSTHNRTQDLIMNVKNIRMHWQQVML